MLGQGTPAPIGLDMIDKRFGGTCGKREVMRGQLGYGQYASISTIKFEKET